MSNPNGWGDGSVNNNIGWGQGAVNNNISWGKSQITSWSGATDIDGGNAPVNTVAPAITGTAQEGQTLTCSTGTWSGSPTYTYQWKRNGSNIGSATNSTYLLVTADVGQSILCTVTATNALGSSNANSNTVTPTSSVDADAQAFITAAAITDPTQQSAINNLVIGLKADGLWTKMKAVYPFVGGTATTMKFNLKDPRDLDAAFRLGFVGGGTWSNTGYTPNGTNGYAGTFIYMSANLSATNLHTAYYSRTNVANNSQFDCGLTDNTTKGWLIMRARTVAGNATLENGSANFNGAVANSQGLYIGTSTASNAHKIYKNGLVVASSTTAQAQTLFTEPQFFGAALITTGGAYYSTRELAFASVGTGLNDTDATNLNTRVTTFQTALNRNV